MNDIYNFINKKLIVNYNKKKDVGEVFTPIKTIQNMLKDIPDIFLCNPNNKWLDNSSGIGNFMIVVYFLLMDKLKTSIKCDKQRSKHIIENMLYMVEIDEQNVSTCINLFKKINKDAKLNIENCDFLNKKDIFNSTKYDIIIGNPPYQTLKKNNVKTKQIWNFFILESLNILNKNGYLSLIIPNSWRNYNGSYKKIYENFKNLTLLNLKMYSYKQTRKIFPDISICVDIFLLQNKKSNDNLSKIIDHENKLNLINIKNWDFLPSGCFEEFDKILSKNDEKVNVLYSSGMYETRYKHISKIKTNEFIYPICYSITKKNKMNCVYSNIKKEMFIPKVIWSNGVGTYPIIDLKGEYGLTQFAYAIVDDIENLDSIKKSLEHPEFLKLMNLTRYTNNKYNYKIIGLFKKNYWKNFI